MKRKVFTNGCFDILHAGHVDLLRRAKELGDELIVGINSDRSVRSIKGDGRPFNSQDARRDVLLGLRSVDDVIIFDEPTPDELVRRVIPDILVKGGDWSVNEIVGADFVLSNGGQVLSLPLLEGFSSSAAIDQLTGNGEQNHSEKKSNDIVGNSISEHIDTFRIVDETLRSEIQKTGEIIVDTFLSGGKVLICGNGGSAADAQHIAAEFVGRYETERRSLPAIALTTDTSALTAIGNDYGFEKVFARQVESLAREGDCLIAISTSGNSPNVIAAVMEARRHGARIIGLTGAGGKKLASLSDGAILAPSTRTARIQEVHLAVIHIWCEMVDRAFPQTK